MHFVDGEISHVFAITKFIMKFSIREGRMMACVKPKLAAYIKFQKKFFGCVWMCSVKHMLDLEYCGCPYPSFISRDWRGNMVKTGNDNPH
jgi:hypothetical protein